MLIVTDEFWFRQVGPGMQAPLFVNVRCLILGHSVWDPLGTLKFTYGHTRRNTMRTRRMPCGARWRQECGYVHNYAISDPLATMCA
jgi:hypothetical protein